MEVAKLKNSIIDMLEQAKQQIATNMDMNNENASGRTKASLRVEVEGEHIRLKIGNDEVVQLPNGITTPATAPVETLEVGYIGGATKGKAFADFRCILRQWAIDKGLFTDTDKDLGRFTYFTAKKIAREGTERYRNNVDVYSSVVDDTANRLKKEISSIMVRTISEDL